MARKTKTSPKVIKAKSPGGKKKSLAKPGLKTPADVAAAAYAFMCTEHAFGMTEWTREELATALGYSNPKSDKIHKGIKHLLNEDGLAEGKGKLRLSEKGLSQMPVEEKPKSLAEVHERFITQLEQKASAGGKKKVRELWKILKDRKSHKTEDLAKQLGYSNVKSFGNTKLLTLMTKLELITKTSKSSVKMTDKPFPSNLVSKDDIVEF